MALDQIEIDDSGDTKMSFFDHIEALRWHIIRSVIVILVFMVLGFVYKDILFDDIIFGPKNLNFWSYRKLCELSHLIYGDDSACIKDIGFVVSNITMSGQFTQHIFVSFIGGLICAFPYVLWEAWRFIKPALKSRERRYTRGVVAAASSLFFVGVLFGYYFLTPVSINFLGTYKVSPEVTNEINLESYISFVATLTFASGLVFELPVVVYFLAKIGLITADFMRKYRRHAFLVIIVIAAVVTPPDVTSQVLMTIPIYALYEVSIFIAIRVERKKAKALNSNT